MPNSLSGEKSPYLLQHAENPVDWHPWGNEALSLAQSLDKPILVSVGYSACHWCHVMAHESFEDATIAGFMNEHFVNIKVDREERPDVDAIYMEAVQAMSGQGGWPLNVFLTPDGLPFFGGTYFPPVAGRGIAAWPDVLAAIADAYRERRADLLHNAAILTRHIAQAQTRTGEAVALNPDLLRAALRAASHEFDHRSGGFGGAPKFPQPLGLDLILRLAHRFDDTEARDFVLFSLRHMQAGGIYDQLGGGFARYSVDGHWLVPHFEKMLYDNALLARTYLHAFQVSGDPLFRSVVEQTLDYMLRVLVAPDGAFFSSEDADSERVEGKFYVWTPDEFERVLGPKMAALASARYGVSPEGNFDGVNILIQARSLESVAAEMGQTYEDASRTLDQARLLLLAARSNRIRPGLDTKILTAWNGLAIQVLAEAGRALKQPRYLVAARRAADFILAALRPEGRLLRSYREGPSTIGAFLEDYAFLAEALVSL
ncbi:MAG: thioredoxin domain-containing protein, partial [Chloroflexota bacterium]